jgi:hypothetical protein
MGNVFECEKGKLVMGISGSAAYAPDGQLIQRFSGPGDHFRNFADVVKSRKRADLNSEVLEGHLSTALCHLANISYRLGATKPAGEVSKALRTDAGHEAADRVFAHLKENSVDVDKTEFRIGKPISIDPKTERFGADEEANKLATREYRKPYVVPENV